MIANYNILEENLGKGSYSKVQLIEKDNKEYALKKIFIKNFEKDDIKKAEQEVEILKKFNSEYITKYYDSNFEKDEYLNILMEYGGKSNLGTFIQDFKEKKINEFIDEKIIKKVVLQICLGLKEIHKANIIHRDIKPENIFIDESYNIKIGDFGLSKILQPNKSSASSNVGTLAYQAPEILKGKYNNKTDIYSLGCIIYELLTLNNYYYDKMTDEVKKIDTTHYNEKWQDLIDLLLNKVYNKRPNIKDVYIYITNKMNTFTFSEGDEITLIYSVVEEGNYSIFGSRFVENNKNNINLIINEAKTGLISSYFLEKGENFITLKIKNNVINLEYMFYGCCSSSMYIGNLEYFNTKNIYNFSNMFFGRQWLGLYELKDWDVSNGKDFSCMFGCSRNIEHLDEIENWKVSKGENFFRMFYNCSQLTNIKGLEKWDVSKGSNFKGMFNSCSSLTNLDGLRNWKVSNGYDFSHMFFCCNKLNNLGDLENWNVSKGDCFEEMFYECTSLKSLDGLEYWDFSKARCFKSMFRKCSALSDISKLENWNVSNVKFFAGMFDECSQLKNLYALRNWNVSKGQNFSYMFHQCKNLSSLADFVNWRVSKESNVSYMFSGCDDNLDLNILNNWGLSKEKKDSMKKNE